MNSRLLFRAAGVLATTGAAVLASSGTIASAAGPVAHAARSCSVGNGRGFGYTYLTSLSESGTTCAVATGVAKKHGRVSGWSCTTKRLATSTVQYVDQETCHSGSRTVVWKFSQNA